MRGQVLAVVADAGCCAQRDRLAGERLVADQEARVGNRDGLPCAS